MKYQCCRGIRTAPTGTRYAGFRIRFVIVLLGCVLASGCKRANESDLPAPIGGPVEKRLTGKLYRFWRANEFELEHDGCRHYLLLRGVACPGRDEPGFSGSRGATVRLTQGKQVTVTVSSRDALMREVAEVQVPAGENPGPTGEDPFDLALALLRLGWARVDGPAFENTERYLAAESEARGRRLGIWADEPRARPAGEAAGTQPPSTAGGSDSEGAHKGR